MEISYIMVLEKNVLNKKVVWLLFKEDIRE